MTKLYFSTFSSPAHKDTAVGRGAEETELSVT